MPWPTSEEVGNIVARLAIAGNNILVYMLNAAEKAGDKMLPEDVGKLLGWASVMRALAHSLSSKD